MHRSFSVHRLKLAQWLGIRGLLWGAAICVVLANVPARGQSLDRGSLPTAAPTPSVPGSNATDEATQKLIAATTVASVVVTDEGVQSAYGAPAAFSRSRFANLTNAYVLPPYNVYAGLIYEGDALRYEHPDHLFTQEIEVGLPYRLGVAVENEEEVFRRVGQENSLSVEVRYALADWDKIPLNPTLFAEYRFGIGNILHDEGIPTRLDKGEGAAEAQQTSAHTPDAVELRLLLAEEFFSRYEWAFNFFFEQEDEGDRGREWGFAQSFLTPVLLPKERLKLGLEMQYRNFTDKDSRDDPSQGFVIGPTVAFKPTRNTRLDLSPLFGVTFDAPRVQAFAVFSYTFGRGGEEHEAEEPASTRNR